MNIRIRLHVRNKCIITSLFPISRYFMALAHRNIFLMNTPYSVTIRDTADGITTGYRLVGRGSIIGKGKRSLFTPRRSNCLGMTLLPIQWILTAISPILKRQRLQTDTHLHCGEVKISGVTTRLPHMPLWYNAQLIKNKDNLPLNFTVMSLYVETHLAPNNAIRKYEGC
jgi:hypothetical protein